MSEAPSVGVGIVRTSERQRGAESDLEKGGEGEFLADGGSSGSSCSSSSLFTL